MLPMESTATGVPIKEAEIETSSSIGIPDSNAIVLESLHSLATTGH